MIVASRKGIRPFWFGGSVLIGVVLIKMLLVDLAASDTIARIITFIVVGALLVAMGYFAPLPKSDKNDRPV